MISSNDAILKIRLELRKLAIKERLANGDKSMLALIRKKKDFYEMRMSQIQSLAGGKRGIETADRKEVSYDS